MCRLGPRSARAVRGPLGRVHMGRVQLAALLALLLGGGCDGCFGERDAGPPSEENAGASGLTPEQARQVLARVGDHTITLGHYAAALERMDPLERIRYQTADRRQQLLDELINVELLAREAERRGLDRQPEVVELVREYQRDELLRRLNASAPKPAEISAAEVNEYYQKHRMDFAEPERRRGAHIALESEAKARQALAQAQAATPEGWQELVARHGRAGGAAAADKTEPRPPIEVPGDLGLLAREADTARPDAVSEALRAALFRIPEVGQVYPELVADGGRYHIVRLSSKVEARQRTLSEVEDAVRARIVAERQAEARAGLISRLRETTQVSIDEGALERVPAPGPAAAGSAAPRP